MSVWTGICVVGMIAVLAVTTLIVYVCCVAAGRADDRMDALKKQMNHEDV